MGTVNRRDVLRSAAALAAASREGISAAKSDKPMIALFSKPLSFLNGEELAAAVKGIGFEAIDLAVRPGGHVEPDRVRQDLPRLAGVVRKAGLEIAMCTTAIVDAATPHAEEVIASMTGLGIMRYRWGGFRWTKGIPFARQIEAFRPRVAGLAEINRRYGATAMYHTHSGAGLVGASIWDLHEILREFDPHLVGVNYDVGHATVEGGLGGWIDSFNITGAHLQGIAVKDFLWELNARGEWEPAWKPLGRGMVRFPQFFSMLRDARFAGPLQLHFEYSLGGAEDGLKSGITMPRQEIFSAMKRDLAAVRSYMAAAGLA